MSTCYSLLGATLSATDTPWLTSVCSSLQSDRSLIVHNTAFVEREVASVLTSLGDWALWCRAEAHEPAANLAQIYCGTCGLRSDRLRRSSPATIHCADRFSRS